MVTTRDALHAIPTGTGRAGFRTGLSIGRHFTVGGVHPYDQLEWELRDAVITDWRTGAIAFEQRDVEFPKTWSMNATTIVAQKYFRGQLGTPERERSVRQMVDRVADTITDWGAADGYFADADSAEAFNAELKHLLVNQMAAFNSPVWFNVGVEEHPQCSACQPYGALVSTPQGFVPIGEIVERNLVGLEVLDSTGSTRVEAVKHNGRKRVCRVRLQNGSYVEATADHLVRAVAHRRTAPHWSRIDALKPGMRLHLQPHRLSPAQDDAEPLAVSEAALAGWLQSDGFVGRYETGTNRSLTIEFLTANSDEEGWVKQHLDVVFPDAHRKVRPVEGLPEMCRTRLYGEHLREFVQRYGLLNRRHDITVPEQLWTAPGDVVKAYLRSVFQAEGFVASTGGGTRVGWAVISERWSEQIQLLLQRLGIYSRRYRKDEPREDRCDLWQIDVSYLSERHRFAALVGFIGFDKQERLLDSLAKGGERCPDLREELIVAIDDLGEQDVYDIQTGSEQYLSNNVVVHNCFILSVEDTMSSILNWYVEEGTIFKGGSGSGVNLSRIRSSSESLKGGGTASGPVSFMRGADASAGTIKSGGKTRRAAKMVILDVGHPDVEEFIWCKSREELKARALREAGFDMDLDGKDSASVQYQNANNSVRVDDDFMHAVESGAEFVLRAVTTGEPTKTLPARDLFHQIAQAAWECADPGVQYDTTINDWHTTPNAGRINGSNPCCFTGGTLVATSQGPVPFEQLEKRARAGEKLPRVRTFDLERGTHALGEVTDVWVAGTARTLVEVRTAQGLTLRCTPEHRFLTRDGDFVEAQRLRIGDALRAVSGEGYDVEDWVLETRSVATDEDVYDLEVAGTHNFAVLGDGAIEDEFAVVVHNSEYMHLDNSACNLASLNLRSFEADGVFDVESFRRAVEIVFTAQEILVGNSSYPTERIGENARAYRQLGLGYANLGSLLMSQGLAYDSDEGRAWTSAITALMTGHAYATSARIAEVKGPFAGYAADRDGMLRVIGKHRDALGGIDTALAPANLLDAACQSWTEALELGRQHGVRNAQASVLAPTGCLVGGSLVATDRGLVRLTSLGDPAGAQWQDLDIQVVTDEGPRTASKFYVNGLESVVTVDTSRGYRIQGTPRHRVKVVSPEGRWEWKHFADISEGDMVPLALDQRVGEPQQVRLPPLAQAYWTGEHHARAPREMTAELAEFLGYFMGDGSLHARGLRLCVTRGDVDVLDRLILLGKSLFGLEAHVQERGGYTEVAFHSVRLVEWWEACGFARHQPTEDHRGKGWHPHIPDALLHSNDPEVYAAFLRGLFEADGTVTVGYPHWGTTSLAFSRDVQTLLLALGFPTTRKFDQSGWGGEVAVLRLLNLSYNSPWLERIGFMSRRKNNAVATSDGRQAARKDRIPVSRELVDRLAPANDRVRKVLLMELNRHGAVSRRIATELHRRSADAELGHLLRFFYDQIAHVELGEDELTYDLSVPDNVTYVANGFVSHNTIAFLMDCDTTGIEPDLGLVKGKKLVGGGSMRIVNQTVPVALQRLGYQPEQIEAIVAYVDEHATVEGAPALRPEHLPVFDCAMGERSIAPTGHLRMMAAAQPWISGAISKTVNVPETTTVEDVEAIFLEGWKLGLKAIAIYRDNCKVAQPLSISKKEAPAATVQEAEQQHGMVRRRLPKQRPSQTFSFQVGDAEGYLTSGEYPGDGLGEIFVKLGKQGSTLSGVMDALAISVSLGLQYGVPLEAYVRKFINMRFEPAGLTDDPEVRFASSLVDYLFRRLAIEYLPTDKRRELGILTMAERSASLDAGHPPPAPTPEPPAPLTDATGQTVLPVELPTPVNDLYGDAPMCYTCGIQMQPAGSCYVCSSCGTTSGCS